MKIKFSIASCLMLVVASSSHAEQLVVTQSTFTPSKPYVDYTLHNDGFMYMLSNASGIDTLITKQALTGKVSSLGNIPHPDIQKLEGLSHQNNEVQLAVNKFGTLVAAYKFYNASGKYQIVFYKYKEGKWTRLTDIIDAKTNISINKMYLDDNENIYFYSINPTTFYMLQNGEWSTINTLASNPKYEIHREKVFNITKNDVYSTGIDAKSYTFNVYKYKEDSINYSTPIDITDKTYEPACTTTFGENKVISAFINNHSNITNKSIKFELIDLNNYKNGSTGVNSNDSSLIGSIFSLGKATVNLVSGSNNHESSTTPNSQSTTIKEIDLKDYSFTNTIQCTTVRDISYFVLKTYKNNYIYFKITK